MTQIKLSMPLIDSIELQRIDNFYNDIVDEYTKAYVKEKEQVIFQRLLKNLREENQQLKEKLNCDLKWALKYDELFFENEQLKDRINKAIEYIDKHIRIDDEYPIILAHMELLIEERDELIAMLKEDNKEGK